MISEFSLVEKIKKWIPRNLQGLLPLGDDAGLLKSPQGHSLVFTADTIVEGIDFYASPSKKKALGFLTPEKVGRKALAVNLSDIAAMGATPFACVMSLGIPQTMKESWLRDFYRGLVGLAREYKVLCCGGDITQSKEFFASIAMLGTAGKSGVITRQGARPGDWIAVTGALGGSLLKKHYAFQPRIREAQFLTEKFKPTSMIDLSDGLLQDLGHLLKASGTGAELEMLEIPISGAAVHLSKNQPWKALERACTDGEDFELLFTVRAQEKKALEKAWRSRFPKTFLNWIGKVTPTVQKITWLQKGMKTAAPSFKKRGYEHFS